MKTAVLYFTKTGHSKKLASAIANALACPAIDAATEPVLRELDLLFIAGGLYGGLSDPGLLKAVDKISAAEVREVVLVTSNMGEKPQEEVRRRLLDKGVRVAREEFICKGGFLLFSRKSPTENDVQNAVDFARQQRLAKESQ